jgi:aminoglycoside 3-N-acetyltransferase
MRITYYIKRFLKSITSSVLRRAVKRKKRHLKQLFSKEEKTTLEDFRRLLTDTLGIKKGDWLLVSSSFGNLNADFTPRQAIEVLQYIVTKEGLIMMPYYPPMNSTEWAESGQIFDMLETKSGMGVLTNVFSKMPDVHKSIHPTKAVCYWGKVEFIDNKHYKAITPFYWDSPYGELLRHDSKSLCLGLKNIPIFHAFEDILSEHYYDYYYTEKKKLKVRLPDRMEIEVETYVHNLAIIDRCVPAGDYVRNINPPTYQRIPYGLKYVVVVDNKKLFETVKEHFTRGDTRLRG